MKPISIQSGQALVEFALMATLMISLLLGIFDFGRAYSTQVQIKNAVADAGYFAIQNPGSMNDAGIRNAIKRQLGHLSPAVQNSDITITRSCTSTTPGAGVGRTQIEMRYQYQLLFSWIVPNAQVSLGNETFVPQLAACP
jgi:Flp pilus assembly protein TadG